jgi:hypothetical protein
MADENEVETDEAELEEEPDEEFDDEELLDDDDVEDIAVVDDDDDEVAAVEVVDDLDEDADDAEPVVVAKKVGEEEEEDEDDDDPDDVEADLDTILKDRIAAGDDLDDEEEEEVPDRNDPDAADGVAAKKEGEFTCSLCFLIVHPRQFGRRDRLVCPEGYDTCPSIAIVSSMK